MIRYSLRCDQGHKFDGWFRSADGFDAMAKAGQVSCSVCGSAEVSKELMAPAVPSRDSEERPLAAPGSELETAVAELRRQIETNSDYVGSDFATQARAMHDGEMPKRSIHGEAKLEEARKLVEDGVPVMPLPFQSRGKLS